MNELDIASLLCSRICHDLVSPVGAIINGLEVLADDDDRDMQAHALSLIGDSAESASAKLKFMRIAFGAAATLGDTFSSQDIGAIVEAMVKGGRITIDWAGVRGSLPRDRTKLLLNLVLLGFEALPRGGTVSARCTPRTLSVTSTGANASLPENMSDILRGLPGAVPDHRSVVAFVARQLAEAQNSGISCQMADDEVIIEMTGG